MATKSDDVRVRFTTGGESAVVGAIGTTGSVGPPELVIVMDALYPADPGPNRRRMPRGCPGYGERMSDMNIPGEADGIQGDGEVDDTGPPADEDQGEDAVGLGRTPMPPD